MSYIKSNDLFERIPTEELYQRVPRPMLIADHLMTPDNLGALIRLADNIGATEVCLHNQRMKSPVLLLASPTESRNGHRSP